MFSNSFEYSNVTLHCLLVLFEMQRNARCLEITDTTHTHTQPFYCSWNMSGSTMMC